MLNGVLDSQSDHCFMSKVQPEPISFFASPTDLYLLNMLDICLGRVNIMYRISSAKEKHLESEAFAQVLPSQPSDVLSPRYPKMPPMVDVLKTIAEALIHLLTLLL